MKTFMKRIALLVAILMLGGCAKTMEGLQSDFIGIANNIDKTLTGVKGRFTKSDSPDIEQVEMKKDVPIYEVEMPKYTSQRFTTRHREAMPICAQELNEDWFQQGLNMQVKIVPQKSKLAKDAPANLRKAGTMALAVLTKNRAVTKAGRRIMKTTLEERQKFVDKEMNYCVQRKVSHQLTKR